MRNNHAAIIITIFPEAGKSGCLNNALGPLSTTDTITRTQHRAVLVIVFPGDGKSAAWANALGP